MSAERSLRVRDELRALLDREMPLATDPTRQDRAFALLDAFLIEFADMLLEEMGGAYVSDYAFQRTQSFVSQIFVKQLVSVIAERQLLLGTPGHS